MKVSQTTGMVLPVRRLFVVATAAGALLAAAAAFDSAQESDSADARRPGLPDADAGDTARRSHPRRCAAIPRRPDLHRPARRPDQDPLPCRLQRAAFLDISRQVSVGGEQGMFSVAFHPRFSSNGLFYVCYTDRSGAVIVAEYRSAGARAVPDSARVLVRVPHPDSHNGGQLAFGPDGRLRRRGRRWLHA